MKTSRFTLTVAAAAAAMVLAATGCASSSSGSSNSSDTKPSASTSAAAGVAADIVTQAKADTTRPTSIGFTEKFTGKIPKNKTIDFITCGVPSCFQLGIPVKAAVEKLGWKFRQINAGLTPETVQAAWNTALQDPPSGIITLSFPSSIFSAQLAKAKALGIPVATQSTSDVAGNGLTAVYTNFPYFCASGEALARQVISGGGMDVESVMFQANAYVTLAHMQDCYKNYMAAHCPKCKVYVDQLPTASIGSNATALETTWLTAHPKVKWAYPALVDVTTGLPQALAAAGLSGIKLVTANTNAALDEQIKAGGNNGNGVVAVATYPNQEVSYQAVDVILRDLAGVSTAESAKAVIPSWVFTAANVPADPTVNVIGGADTYYKLWGLS